MLFKRTWDESCPCVWDRWESDGTSWIIQDLPPEDEKDALDILLKDQCPEETLLTLNNIANDPESLESMCNGWQYFFKQRLTLACYAVSGDKRTLVGLNICAVKLKGENLDIEIRGENFKNLVKTSVYMESKANCLEYLGLDKALIAVGLVVKKEYRGSRIGGRLLSAREPLCQFLGVKGTISTFTGIASQKLAERCGFTTICEITIKQLSEAGLNYPKDDNRTLKIMVKKYE
ncbi:uncharacterized protein LOC131844516 [Achroia grisella]|uniref:uncharacterized protein LOC131844516 n=1 Tax=Achroia grisella TaxID=688607 RepID=UPI0027D21FF8|nr:uncharacterized protein LOC131844516 [Achroia grisella]